LFPAGLVSDFRTTSGEDLEAAAIGWNGRYAQLGRGRAECRHVAVHTARLQVCFEAWSLGMLRTGRPPQGAVTFLVLVGRSGSARIRGRHAVAGEVCVLADGDEVDCRTTGPSQFISVSLERAALDEHLRALFGRTFAELRAEGRLSGLRTDASALRAACLDLAARATGAPGLLRDGAAVDLERKLVKRLCSAADGTAPEATASRGRALALRADAWLRQNLAEPPSIAALCAAVGVCERTLHDAFRHHLDTTPKAYLKALRLNAAHHDLLRGPATKTVTDVALDWGFGHFGWFSQDYRRLFGETPSQTLHRGRRAGPLDAKTTRPAASRLPGHAAPTLGA
jgi:AraC family ethanolamine operon transcriptional activator